jgi:hypothetical protein
MRKKGNIVRYTAEELATMAAGGEDRTDWTAIAAKSEDQLAADRGILHGRGFPTIG